MYHKFILDDNENIVNLPEKSVHLTITSPPYVTTTFKKGQVFEYDEFLEYLERIFSYIYDLTIDGGRFALNVGDILTKYRFKDDDMMSRAPLGPDSLAIAQKCGWRLLERFIWDKGFTRNFGGPLLGTYPYSYTIFNNNYFEYIWILRKPKRRKPVKQEIREASRLSLEEWRSYSQQWWRVESISEKFKDHPAIFPIEIPDRIIKMYSYIGDTVFDPWGGTGATAIASFLNNRNSITIEKDANFESWVKSRISYESSKYDLSNFKYIYQKGV